MHTSYLVLNFVYKHQAYCLPEAFNNYFMLRSDRHNRITRGATDLHTGISKANNNFGCSSIKISGAKTFNQLPKDLDISKKGKSF